MAKTFDHLHAPSLDSFEKSEIIRYYLLSQFKSKMLLEKELIEKEMIEGNDEE
jgi:hypothetical protein